MMISRRALLAAFTAASLPRVAHARSPISLSDILFDPALLVLGNPEGDVTIAEFFDYACPYCKVLHPHLKEIVEQDGGIRLVMKDWPINGDMVMYASRMVHAAGRLGQYEIAHGAVIKIMDPLTHRRIDDAMRSQGVDVRAVRDALDVYLEEIDVLLQRNREQARLLALRGTPSFLIGTNLYRRALTPEQVRAAIDQVREERG